MVQKIFMGVYSSKNRVQKIFIGLCSSESMVQKIFMGMYSNESIVQKNDCRYIYVFLLLQIICSNSIYRK